MRISLLEQPLDQATLAPHFTVYHLPVADVTPPRREQVYAYAHMLRTAREAGQTVDLWR